MKCLKCGNELQEGARFCVFCGTPVENNSQEAKASEGVPNEAAPVEEIVYNPYSEAATQNVQKKSSKVLLGVVGGIVVLLLILAAAFAAIFFMKKGGSSDVSKQLTYAKKGKLYYVKNITKDDEAIIVCTIKNGEEYNNGALAGAFTEDGKYLYFYSKLDSSYSGKLCRVEVAKLKNDEDKNEEIIEDLVSGVSTFELLDENRFIYRNDSSELFYFDGEDKNKIVSNVNGYSISEGNKVNFTTNDNQIGYYLIDEDKSEIVVENCSYVLTETEQGYYYSTYNEDTYLNDLHYCSKAGDSSLVAEGAYTISGASAGNNTAYYVTERVENVCYYDLVNDVYEAQDAAIAEPVFLDYLTPCTEYDAMSDWDREYYAENPEYLDNFYYWLSLDYTYDSGYYYYYSYHVDAQGEYIYSYYYYDSENAQWYSFDETAYYAARDLYYGVADRINLRNSLKESFTDITYYDLHAWNPDNGDCVIASNISPYTVSLVGQSSAVIYQKYGDVDKIDWPEDAYSTWFVEDYIYNARYSEDVTGKYFYNIAGTEHEWDSEWGDLSMGIYFDTAPSGQYVMAFTNSYDENYNYVTNMSAFKLEADALSLVESNVANTTAGIWIGDDFYYYEAASESDGDLYCFSNGKTNRVLKNISNATVRRFENGSYCAYSDYNYYDGGTLKLFDAEGESEKIDSNVSSYCYINEELIVYLRDGKLFVYRGKDEEKFKIDSSVSSFNCNYPSYETLIN